MQPRTIPSGAKLAPVLIAILLSAPTRAQERTFAPLQETSDQKTAPEPTRQIETPSARPSAVLAAPSPLRAKVPDAGAPSFIGKGIDHSRMYYDAPGDGSLWARGAHYKASFAADGATYYPLFGAGQERHLPLALSPDSVTLDGAPLAFERDAPAVRTGDRIEIDRGAFVEVWELAPESVEQLFVFRSLPRAGTLVVHLPVASELEALDGADALEFRSPLGSVSYGRATAIDAGGRRAAAATELRDGSIEIRLEAAFVRDAALPLVIDPVVSTFPIDDTSFNNYWPDVAYDATTDRWLAVYEELAAAGDGDVYYEMLNAAGSSMWGGYVNVNNASWTDPKCANLASATQFLVVAHVSGSGTHTIRGRTIEADIFSIGNEFFISGSESGDKIYPSVGGDPYPFAPAYYCVAYERVYNAFDDDDILVRLVGSDGSLSAVNYLSNSGSTLDDLPSVSRSNGGSTWLISWERHHLSANESHIWAARIRYDGLTLNGPFQVTSASDDTYSCASSPLIGGQRTMIVFQRDYGTDHDIHGVVLDGATVLQNADLSTMESAWFLQDQREASVDSDGQHFLVSYSELYSTSTTDYDVYVCDLALVGSSLQLAQTHVNLAFTGLREGLSRLASTFGSGGVNKRYLVAWQKQTSSTNFDVRGALVDGHEGGGVSNFCSGDGTGGACPCGNVGAGGFGCGNSIDPYGGLLVVTGTPSTWNDTAQLATSNIPNGTTCIFLQSATTTGPVLFGDGLLCLGGSVLRLGSRSAPGGVATFPNLNFTTLHNAGGVPFNGGTRGYQVWYRNSANFCTPSPFNITNGVLVGWAL